MLSIRTRSVSAMAAAAGCMLSAGQLSAQAPSSGAVPADKGSLSGSGKFQSAVPAQPPFAPSPDPAARLAELGVKLDGDRMTIGLVELDRKARTVTVPATIHAVQGVIEYLLVHSKGKLHETLLETEALPNDIHVACLLAGWGKPKEGQSPARIEVNISWETNGPARLEPAGNLVGLTKGSPQDSISGHLKSGTWTYCGSLMDASGFVAVREGSIISVINDPAALVNNAGTDRDNDAIHVPDASLLPPLGTPVKITLRGPP